MKRFLWAAFALWTASFQAQTATDAIRLAYLQPSGTGRFLGVGGAFGALGAEFTATSLNPAGLAMYRTSELVFSPALRFTRVRASLPGVITPNVEDGSSFRFDNLGIVFQTSPRQSRWRTFNVGIGLNQMANFNRNFFYAGYASGTVLTPWFDEAKPLMRADPRGNLLDPFTSRLAFQVNAFYFQNDWPSYDFENNEQADLYRTHTITQSGRVSELVFSLAGNYNERLFIGATFGIPFARYSFEGDYTEEDLNTQVIYFDNLTFTEFYETEGLGLNGKFGLIYRASQTLRLGAYFHTPTAWALTDNFNNTFTYQYTDGSGTNRNTAQSPDGRFDYRLTTPWRAGGGAALVFDRKGFVSADLEWIDYRAAQFNFTRGTTDQLLREQERKVNAQIRRLYGGAVNLRLGGELAFSVVRLRGGVSLLGKPEVNQTGLDPMYSCGIGVKAQGFFLDLGVRTTSPSDTLTPYAGGPVVDVRNRIWDILLSVGFKF